MALPTPTLELSLRCEGLADQDILSKSDPICVLFQAAKGNDNHWIEIGRTECVRDNLNPEWTKKFVVNYSFEERQLVKLEVYDHDGDTVRLDAHDFLGRCTATLGQIVSAQGSQYVAVLKDGPRANGGKIFVSAEELQVNKETIKVQFAAENLDKKDFFGKSDPYVVISKGFSNGKFVKVHETEVIKNTLNPTWKPFNIPVRTLCNNDYDRELKFDVYDWNSSGNSDFIGSFKTNLKSL